METVQGIGQFLDFVVRGLSERPEEVKVTRREEGEVHVFDLHVNGGDVPRLIGKSGGTVNAIRGLAQAAAARVGVRVGVEIVE